MATIVEIRDRIEPLMAEWEHLAQHTKAAPFLWPGWIRGWWRAFGTGRLQILTAHENGRLVGILPLRRFRGALSSTSGWNTPLFGFLAANETAVKRLSDELVLQRPRRIDLSFLSPIDPGVPLVRAAAEAAGYRVHEESIPAAPYVAIDGDWDAYESGLRRKFRSELRRRRRRLEEKGRLTLEVSDGKERLDQLLEEGFCIEGLGWKDAYGTSINSGPATRRFYTEVAHWTSECGWLRLAFLRLDGRALAFDYCLEYNRTHYLLKTGYDPAYAKSGPGMILRYLMLARAFSEGIATYDFLGVGSDYGWKQEWTNTQQERLFLRMFASTPPGFLDRAVFVGGRSAFEGAKSVARSPFLGERGHRFLKRAHAMVHGKVTRR
ncbi:MAG: GNAT family N-acetyltransferase [Actinomycetota bacterium]|nr:GNAT family N-acetyltransferase [Actinomycetota bacterium]